MNNYERIKNMSIDEMANTIFSFQACSVFLKKILREEEIKQWLLEEYKDE